VKITLVILALTLLTSTQSKPQKQPSESPELAELGREFIQATEDYKGSLQKLLASYQKNVTRAQERLAQAQSDYDQGLISISDLEGNKRTLADAKDKVEDVRKREANADKQIAETLLDAEVAAKEFKKAKGQRRTAKQRPCSNWTMTVSQHQTKRSLSLNYKFICLD
jgi:hypothetical protein